MKLENTQDTGSFKIRGAANAILRACELGRVENLVAASSGNHGRAVAYVASRLGLTATVCMTTLVPEDKIASIHDFGARTVIHGDDQNAAVEKALSFAEREDTIYIPPFDDPDVISGQGTVGLEMLLQCPELDVLVVPVSGGGLMSGVAVAARAMKPAVRIVGVTSERDGAIYESLKVGEVVAVPERASIADALPGPIPLDNQYTFSICQELVDKLLPVPENSIAKAMRYVLDQEKMVLEGAGAAALAYAIDHVDDLHNKTVGIVCSGCNISSERLAAIFEEFSV